MPRRGIWIAAFAICASIGACFGQAGPGDRMSIDRLGDVQEGTYTASNGVSFTLTPYAAKYLLHFAGDPEVFVLYVDHASLGGRVLKFDSGETALAVSGWGAVTIYTDQAPGGLPAERTAGSGGAPSLPILSLAEMQKAAADETAHLAYARGLHIAFAADWAALAADIPLRMLTFDAMQNAARGLDRFAASAAARAVLAAKMDTVHMVIGGRPTITLHGKTLLVNFSPLRGFEGRASSHAIARALGQMFSIPTAG
jgi:hypothetical protein